MMNLQTYGQIYVRFDRHERATLMTGLYTAVFFAGLLFAGLAFFKEHTQAVLSVFHLILLFLYGIVALINDGKDSPLYRLVAFFRNTPVRAERIVFLTYLRKAWNMEQLLLYAGLTGVLLYHEAGMLDIALFLLQIQAIVMITQVMEYLVLLLKQKLVFQFLVQLLVVLLLVIAFQTDFFRDAKQLIGMVEAGFLPIALLALAAGSLAAAVPLMNRLLAGTMPNVPRWIVFFSRLLSLSAHLLFFHPVLRSTVRILILRYLRDLEVLIKHLTLAVMMLVFSTISFLINETQGYELLLTLTWLLSLYFFAEVRLKRLLDRGSHLSFFPLPPRVEKIAVDLAGGLLFLFVCTLVLIFQSFSFHVPKLYILHSLCALVIFYLLSVAIEIPSELTSKRRLLLQVAYGALCLTVVLLFRLVNDWFVILACFALALGFYARTVQRRCN